MESIWSKDYTIMTSLCDARGLLGIKNIFDIFMDMASEHAARLGVGYYDMLERRCFWIAVRTRVKLYGRPRLGDTLRAETWPGKPGLAKSDRFYRILRDGAVMAEGRTEWAVQDIDTGAVRRTDSYGFPMELGFRDERVCEAPFRRFRAGQTAPEYCCAYTVGSQDIDVGHHMNNVAYVRMLLGTFTTAELAAMDVTEAEISYRLACFEGEELAIERRREADGFRFDVLRPDGQTAAQAMLVTG